MVKFRAKTHILCICIFAVFRDVMSTENSNSCNFICREDYHFDLKYEPGKTYLYSFRSDVATSIVGTTDERTGFSLLGSMHLVASNESCDVTIILRNVRFESLNGTADADRGLDLLSLEGSSLRFQWERPNIPKICLSPEDSTLSANVKRALASLFVNAGDKVGSEATESQIYETDSSGKDCSPKYKRQGEIYTKTMDFSTCRDDREGGRFLQLGTPAKPCCESEQQRIQIFHSEQKCVQNFTGGLLQSAQCSETHQLTPFSLGKSGMQTQVNVTLKLDEIQDGPAVFNPSAAKLTMDSTIEFDHAEVRPLGRLNDKTLKSATQELCAALDDPTSTRAVNSTILRLSSILKKAMRWAKQSQLLDLAQEIKGKCLDIFIRTAFLTSTGETIKFLLGFHGGQIPEEHIGLFTMQSVFAERLDAETIQAVTVLISNKAVNPQLLLAAGSLAYKHTDGEKESQSPEVAALTNEIVKHVNNEDKNEERTIVALQALGNLRNLTSDAVSVILRLNQSANRRVKLNALQSFRRVPCEENLRNASREVLGDTKEFVDIRIAAFLAFVKCQDPHSSWDDSNYITNVTHDRSSTHLTNFIKSYDQNQSERKGNDPRFPYWIHAPEVRQPTNPLKISRNFLLSDYTPQTGIGRSVEGNIIYSPDSFVPRTLSGKIGMEFNQRSYQVAEVGINFQGMETILEKYFGPDAGKSSAPSGYGNPAVPSGDSSAVADAHFRLFGTTVRVDFYDGEALIKTGKSLFDLDLDIGLNLDWSSQFLHLPEYEVTIPTVAGFPLKFAMDVNGHSSLKCKRSGGGDLDLKARAATSGNVNGGVSVLDTGVEFDTHLNFARAIDLKWRASNSNSAPALFTFGIPMDSDQVAEIRNNLYWVNGQRSKVKVNELRAPEVDKHWCSKTMLKYTGLNLCTYFKMPQAKTSMPWFPLDGENVLRAEMTKSEVGIHGFFVKAKTSGLKGKFPNTAGFASISIDTPGSSKDLRTNLDVEVKSKYFASNSTREMSLDLKLDAWWQKDFKMHVKSIENPTTKFYEIMAINKGKKHGLQGRTFLRYSKRMKNARGDFKMSSISEYDLFQISPKGSSKLLSGALTNEFESENEIDSTFPTSGDLVIDANLPEFYIQGNVTAKWQQSPNASVDFLVFNVTQLKGVAKGNLGDISLNGFANISKTFAQSTLWFDAKYGKKSEKDLTFNANYDFTVLKMPSFDLRMDSSATPSLNFEGNLNIGGESAGGLIRHPSSQLLISESATYKASPGAIGGLQVKHDANFSLPLFDDIWTFSSQTEAPNNEGQYLSNSVLKSKNGYLKEAYYDFKFNPNSTTQIMAKLDYNQKLTKFFYELKRVNQSAWNLDYDASIEVAGGNKSTYAMDSKINFQSFKNWDAVTNLHSNQIQKPISVGIGLKTSSDEPYSYWYGDREAYARITQSDSPDAPIFDFLARRNRTSPDELFLLRSSLHNIFNTSTEYIELTSNDTSTHMTNTSTLTWQWEWLPTTRKFVINSTWQELEFEGDNSGQKDKEWELRGQIAWDAKRDQTKNIQCGIFESKVISKGGNSTDLRTLRTTFEIQGAKIATDTRYYPDDEPWLTIWRRKRWARDFTLNYTTPANQTYNIEIESYRHSSGIPSASESIMTFAGKVNFTILDTPGEEPLSFPLEFEFDELNTTEYGNGYELKLNYQTAYIDPKTGIQYPPFPLNIKYQFENETRLLAACVPSTGDILFLASNVQNETRPGYYYGARSVQDFESRFVQEFWIGGLNYSYIYHSGRRVLNSSTNGRRQQDDFQRIAKSSAPKSEFTEISTSSAYDPEVEFSIPLTSNDDLGSHLLTNLGFNFNSPLIFYKFNWENLNIQNYLGEVKVNLQEIQTGFRRALEVAWGGLTHLRNNSSEISISNPGFNFSGLLNRIKENQTDFLVSRMTPEIVTSTVLADMQSQLTPNPDVSMYPIINTSVSGLRAILDGISSYFEYLSKITPVETKSTNFSKISQSIENGYEALSSKFEPVVQTLHGIHKFLSFDFVPGSGFLLRRLGKLASSPFWPNGGNSVTRENLNALSADFQSDLQKFFPYNETEEFITVFKEYSDSDENEAEDIEVVGKLEFKNVVHKFGMILEKGWNEVYKADYGKGVITSQVPLLFFMSKTYSRLLEFSRPSQGRLPTGLSNFFTQARLRKFYLDIREIILPVDGYAVLIGQNVITFDGQLKTLGNNGGKCKYLLTSDVKSGKFNISANVSTISLTTRNGGDFYLARNGKNRAEIYNGEESAKISVRAPEDSGVEILCKTSIKKEDFCLIKINGFYHGKLDGLFGNFNNEILDDNESNSTNGFVSHPKCTEGQGDDNPNALAPFDSIKCEELMEKHYRDGVSLEPISPAYKKICNVQNWNSRYKQSSISDY